MSTSLVRASIGVPAPAPGERPHPDRLRKAAEELARLGFEVLRIGRRGISVQAEPGRFARVFGVRPEPGRALVLRLELDRTELAGLVESLEVAPEPIDLAR
ncbi:MAG: hypothetical protein KJ058_01975 [Thermoanaerobaculia bacterium]|nr:hypothetical protein [Thermoanaerobaculia bacterium]